MQTIERAVIAALLHDMRAAGYQPAAVWDGEAYVMAGGATYEETGIRLLSSQPVQTGAPDQIARPMTDEEVLEAIDSVDESTLHFTHRHARTWGNRGVSLVLGNGEHVICNYHCANREPFGTVIDAIFDRIETGAIT